MSARGYPLMDNAFKSYVYGVTIFFHVVLCDDAWDKAGGIQDLTGPITMSEITGKWSDAIRVRCVFGTKVRNTLKFLSTKI